MSHDIFVRRRSTLKLDVARATCVIDGHAYEARIGKWTFFISATGEKYLHSRNGFVDTLSANGRAQYRPPGRRYSPEEWESRLSQPADERAAEVYVAAERLFRAGVGPRPFGLCQVDGMTRDGINLGEGFGIICEDANRLRRRLWPATRSDLRRAGVSLDRFRASIRTQIRGYVVDLCSVDPVRPVDAEAEVAEVSQLYRAVRNVGVDPDVLIETQDVRRSSPMRLANRGR